MPFKSPIGISDFAKLRKLGCYYVDKTRLITDLLADPAEVLLFPRPRRFGKTLNRWTLRYFLEKTDEDRAWMFEGLDVWRSEEARKRYQRCQVVFLTFKACCASRTARSRGRVRTGYRRRRTTCSAGWCA